MILVTVGTEQYPFNALMSWVELLIRDELIDRNEEVIVQYGSSSKLPVQVRMFKQLPESEFKDLLKQARVVISHCGEGSVMLMQSLGKPYVLIPRTRRFGEHVDDHQLEMAEAMEKQNIPVARGPGDLLRFLAEPKILGTRYDNEDKLCHVLSNHSNCNKYKKIMVVCSSGGHFKYAQSLKPFLDRFQHICWVTFQTDTTKSQLNSDKERTYWAHYPTNRNLPNLLRNLVLAFKVIHDEQPDLVISTGAGVSVPFLWIAKFFYKKRTVFIESKTRLKKLSLSAKILYFSLALDQLIVRSTALKERYYGTEYINTIATTSAPIEDNNRSNNILKLKDTAFLKTPICLDITEVSQFNDDFQKVCELAPKKIVLDLCVTVSISNVGFKALVNSLKMANDRGIKLVLWSVNPEVMSALLRSKLNEVFPIEEATLAVRPQSDKISKPAVYINSILQKLSYSALN